MKALLMRSVLIAGCVVTSTNCAADTRDSSIDAREIGTVWVFFHAFDDSDQALHSGPATVVDDCLLIGDAVVVWREDQSRTVEQILDAIDAGRTPTVRLGGGGLSLEEGSTLEDFPPSVVEHCTATEVWGAGDGPISVDL